jgi:hypothetical protein
VRAVRSLLPRTQEKKRSSVAAYGWPVTLTDAELLERLLALNHARANSN